MIGAHYDPMLAKVVAWAPTRDAAARRLAAALAGAQLHGARAPTATCWSGCCGRPEFAAGPDTGFLDGSPELLAPLAGPAEVRDARRWRRRWPRVGAGARATAPVQAHAAGRLAEQPVASRPRADVQPRPDGDR